ncbi:type II toxin-antitoxin system VapC family toxin [Dyadobacter aurulentus]|uniref:type II toxin-antitoxin system VapC family toxin n=1 Tax=Dyadobacter sp. UC 10 TaxID=2605428 RepID=UPI0011F2D47A|nr:type II toxin-antitoxin system VapC family toxin [Dyadobacter sp. UC 10]KAA0992511.1 type II toxin-antitoxin system VapC family toxin [Dyadobacter sp. UC 10]
MTYLLDTHTIIWALTAQENLSKAASRVLSDAKNTIFVSTISFWEISLKYSLGKLSISNYRPDLFPQACLATGFQILQLDSYVASTYHNLPPGIHKDPFDRILIWQAISSQYTLITADKTIHSYASEGLGVLW